LNHRTVGQTAHQAGSHLRNNSLPSTHIAGGFLFRFAQLPEGINAKEEKARGFLPFLY